MVIGLGRSGYAVAQLLRKIGAEIAAADSSARKLLNSEVLVWLDENRVPLSCGELTDKLLEGVNLVVPSPGVPLDQPFFNTVRSRGIEIVGELALAASIYRKPIIAITGTNGKSTVTELIGEIMISSGFEPFVGGNLGVPLAEHLLKPDQTDLAVLEVSSFQLDTAPGFRPDIAILLNISPDHLDRYRSYDAYAASKFSIFSHQDQDGQAIINSDDPEVLSRCATFPISRKRSFFGRSCPSEHPSAMIAGAIITLSLGSKNIEEQYDLTGSFLENEPNSHNAAAAILAARLYGCPKDGVEKAIQEFKPLEHRMSLVGEVAGVRYYDDSKATNIGAVSAALSGFDTPVILIAGGRDKGGDYRLMLDPIRDRVKAMVLIGEAREKMVEVFSEATEVYTDDSLQNAVTRASMLASPGDSVLLSPACASFDMFDSYSHRGDVFRVAVESMMKN